MNYLKYIIETLLIVFGGCTVMMGLALWFWRWIWGKHNLQGENQLNNRRKQMTKTYSVATFKLAFNDGNEDSL